MAVNQVLLDYIQNQIRKGYAPDYLKDFLIGQGYDASEVTSAIEIINKDRAESIKSYINQETKAGYNTADIRSRLLSYGYKAEEVDSAMNASMSRMPNWSVLAVIVALVLIGGTLYFIAKPSTEVVPQLPVTQPEESVDVEEPVEPAVTPQEIEEETEFQRAEKVYDVINASKDQKIMKAVQMCENTANEIYKDACFDQLSKATRDSSLCDKIIDSVQKDNCYKRTAIYTRNPELCQKVSDPSIRSECQLYDYV